MEILTVLKRSLKPLAQAMVFVSIMVACGQPAELEPEAIEVDGDRTVVTGESAPPDNLHLDLQKLDTKTWVRRFVPERASSGYNLVLYQRRLPILLDMNGNIVHAWPAVRAVSRARLNREGHLLVIARGNLVEEYDWDGKLTWYFQMPRRDLTHHDLIQLANRNYLVLARDGRNRLPYLSEVDSDQNVVWQWMGADHLPAFPGWDPDQHDLAHVNSINELPANAWFDAGDARFRPGNILVSARNLNTIFIIDRESGEVVWQYSDGLDFQHEAIMVEKDRLGAGLITVFNNGLNNIFNYRRSSVQAIDPVNNRADWEYSSDFFFSGTGGTARRLAGGTTLITSTHGHRVFEVDDKGRNVWELVLPGQLGRAERVAYDHCPQLQVIPRPVEMAVKPDHWGPYVDADLYNFEPSNRFGRKSLAGRRTKVLPWGDTCRDLLLPPGASMEIGCGFVEEIPDGMSLRARFKLSIISEGSQPESLIDHTIDESSEKTSRWFRLRLHRFAYKKVKLCVSTEVDGSVEKPERLVAWAYPKIKSKWQTPEPVVSSYKLSKQERELQKRQLEALGYVE